MPIGVVGSKSLALHFWGSRRFSNKEREKTNTCLCCFLPPRWNTLMFTQATVKTTITHINFRHYRVSFSPFVRQPFSKQLYPRNSLARALEYWIINLLLDVLLCSIAENFFSLFVFWLALRARQNTAQLVKILSDSTQQNVEQHICIGHINYNKSENFQILAVLTTSLTFRDKKRHFLVKAVSDICRLQTADCRLQTADYRLETTDCRLHITDCIQYTSDSRL